MPLSLVSGHARTRKSDTVAGAEEKRAPRDPVVIDPTTGHVVIPGHQQSRFRTARFHRFLRVIDLILADRGSCRILDLGGTPAYWAGFDRELNSRNVSITIVNLLMQPATSSRISLRVGDATDLSHFGKNSFDIVHSNSVIEHVGDWTRMQAFAGEATRLAPAYFVQTPNFWFPLDLHSRTPFFHWLPVQLRIKLLMHRRCGFYPRARTVEEALSHIRDANCLTRTQMQKLFAGASIERERFFGMTKSWIAVRG